MYYVYVLRSVSHPNQVYSGFSSVDIATRLARHNTGSTPATRRYVPWDLAWYAAFPNKQRALEFETYLKSGSGRAFLHKRLVDPPSQKSIAEGRG